MPEFRYLERPVYSPTACAFCGATDVPVIDTGLERDVIGRLYVCCKPDPTSTNYGCAEQIAFLLGWANPDEHTGLVEELARQHEQNEQLTTELQNADQPLVIYASDLESAIKDAARDIIEELTKKPKK